MFWSKIGHFSKALSKGLGISRWMWNIHADAHDLDGNQCYHKHCPQILAANLAHIGVVLFWLAGMHFFIVGSYFTIHCMALVGLNVETLISSKHMLWFLGISSLAFSGHTIHIALPCTSMLVLGIDCSLIPNGNKILDRTWTMEYFGGIGWNYFMPVHLGLFTNQLDPLTGSIFLGQIRAHHAFVGISLVLLSMLFSWSITS